MMTDILFHPYTVEMGECCCWNNLPCLPAIYQICGKLRIPRILYVRILLRMSSKETMIDGNIRICTFAEAKETEAILGVSNRSNYHGHCWWSLRLFCTCG